MDIVRETLHFYQMELSGNKRGDHVLADASLSITAVPQQFTRSGAMF
jgi:hypothetical protein